MIDSTKTLQKLYVGLHKIVAFANILSLKLKNLPEDFKATANLAEDELVPSQILGLTENTTVEELSNLLRAGNAWVEKLRTVMSESVIFSSTGVDAKDANACLASIHQLSTQFHKTIAIANEILAECTKPSEEGQEHMLSPINQ